MTIGAGAKILGPVTIGHDSRIGANAVVVKHVPSDSVVVGVPGQIVSRSRPRPPTVLPDLDHIQLPDVLRASLAALLARVDQLERAVGGTAPEPSMVPAYPDVWAR